MSLFKLALKINSSYKDFFLLFCLFSGCENSPGKLEMLSLIFLKCIIQVFLRFKIFSLAVAIWLFPSLDEEWSKKVRCWVVHLLWRNRSLSLYTLSGIYNYEKCQTQIQPKGFLPLIYLFRDLGKEAVETMI